MESFVLTQTSDAFAPRSTTTVASVYAPCNTSGSQGENPSPPLCEIKGNAARVWREEGQIGSQRDGQEFVPEHRPAGSLNRRKLWSRAARQSTHPLRSSAQEAAQHVARGGIITGSEINGNRAKIKHGFIDGRWCLAHLIPAADKGDGSWGEEGCRSQTSRCAAKEIVALHRLGD